MWDARKYSLIISAIQITNVIVSEGFYWIFPQSPFTQVSEVLQGLCRASVHSVSLEPVIVPAYLNAQ